jgi:dTDP-4-amino-4,6-dideoxygalactose transaminase
MGKLPAISGGKPVFDRRINIVSPVLPGLDEIALRVSEILATGNLTNDSRYVRRFEREVAAYLDGPRVVAVANATLGLMLVLQALDLKGEVIVPSFTFSATVHALLWNSLKPVFADIDPRTYHLDPRRVAERITPATSAILAVHVYGNPCDIEALENLARQNGLRLIFDSAHAFGATYHGGKIGRFGDAEVFSFHATKTLAAGEGGAVCTENEDLAERIAWGRNFGNPGDDDCRFPGLNAKMTEFSAILGLQGLPQVEEWIRRRNETAQYYRQRLKEIPGLAFQRSTLNSRHSHQFFSVLVEKDKFGIGRDELHRALQKEKIVTRKYFYPPVHRHQAYHFLMNRCSGSLPVTEDISGRILCLPIHSDMSIRDAERVVFAIRRLHRFHMKTRRTYQAV